MTIPEPRPRQKALFDGQRFSLDESIQTSLDSLRAYGAQYRHWATAYSGGKDSSATTTFIAWAIREKLIPVPETWTVLLSDTRMELPPLIQAATRLITRLQGEGVDARVVMPTMDDRFYVYMLGRGVPPPKNRFRWCTPQLKVTPMQHALEDKAAQMGLGEIVTTGRNRYQREYRNYGDERLLLLTGVRFGESAIRDQRILLSCSENSGECGQGWFQVGTPESLADTLAPLLHWRLCHVFDWLYFEDARHGYPEVLGIAAVYGDDDIRTGCVGCNLASRDNALDRLIKQPGWEYLTPLLELKPLYRELALPKWRKRKDGTERRADGSYFANPQRMGPLTMAARAYGLERILDIQARARVDLINADEETRIRELWELNTWPARWSADDLDATIPLDNIQVVDGDVVIQPRLV